MKMQQKSNSNKMSCDVKWKTLPRMLCDVKSVCVWGGGGGVNMELRIHTGVFE